MEREREREKRKQEEICIFSAIWTLFLSLPSSRISRMTVGKKSLLFILKTMLIGWKFHFKSILHCPISIKRINLTYHSLKDKIFISERKRFGKWFNLRLILFNFTYIICCIGFITIQCIYLFTVSLITTTVSNHEFNIREDIYR